MYTRFSQLVVADIAAGNYAITDRLLGDAYLCNGRRWREREFSRFARSKTEPDDWDLHLNSWFFGLFPRVILTRGKDNFVIKLSRVEHRGLAEIIRAVFQKQKDEARAAKLEYKRQQELAYFAQPERVALLEGI